MNLDNQAKLNSIVSGIASLVMGVVLWANPTGVALMAVSIVGVILLVLGAVSLFNYFRPGGEKTQVNLFIGIAELVLAPSCGSCPASSSTGSWSSWASSSW